MEIARTNPRIYTYNLKASKEDNIYSACLWARFTFDCDAGALTVNSDAGDYSYRWGYNENEDFMHLMSRIDKYYLLNKISDKSKFLLEESKKGTIENIELNGFKEYGIETEEEWKEYKQKIMNLFIEDERSFLDSVSYIIPDINGEDIYTEKDYPAGAKVIAEMFDKYLQPEIKKEFSKETKTKTDKSAIERN